MTYAFTGDRVCVFPSSFHVVCLYRLLFLNYDIQYVSHHSDSQVWISSGIFQSEIKAELGVGLVYIQLRVHCTKLEEWLGWESIMAEDPRAEVRNMEKIGKHLLFRVRWCIWVNSDVNALADVRQGKWVQLSLAMAWIHSAELAYINLLSLQWLVYSWTFIKPNEKARIVTIILRHPGRDSVCVFMCMHACCVCVCVCLHLRSLFPLLIK